MHMATRGFYGVPSTFYSYSPLGTLYVLCLWPLGFYGVPSMFIWPPVGFYGGPSMYMAPGFYGVPSTCVCLVHMAPGFYGGAWYVLWLWPLGVPGIVCARGPRVTTEVGILKITLVEISHHSCFVLYIESVP